MRFQVPWGKHSPVSFRLHYKADDNMRVDPTHVLPVLVIKDPYTWMSSMCRHEYTADWWHNTAKHCPNLVPITPFEIRNFNHTTGDDASPSIPVIVGYPRNSPQSETHHKSLLHVWNTFYEDYLAKYNEFPFIAIRFEDLLFHTKEVVTQVCVCAGGTMEDKFAYVADSAKQGAAHQGSSGITSAMIRYGNATMRREPYLDADLRYAEKEVSKELMEIFHYSIIR